MMDTLWLFTYWLIVSSPLEHKIQEGRGCALFHIMAPESQIALGIKVPKRLDEWTASEYQMAKIYQRISKL